VRILFLGGTRFIGPWAVRAAVHEGHDVSIFHRGETETDLPPVVGHVHGDFADWDAHVDELRSLEPEVVVDLVPFRADDGRRVLAFAGVARRGVVCSSGDVYRAFGRLWRTEPGPPDPLPLTEESPLREVVIDETYDKTNVERFAQSDPAFPVTVLRLPATHGPRDPQHRLSSYVKRMDDARPAILLDERVAPWRWMRGYVEDVGRAIALAAADERASGRVYNIADTVAHSEADWVRKIASVVGWEGRIVAAPAAVLPPYLGFEKFDLAQEFVIESSRIRRELGYAEAVPEDEGLRRTVEWERAHPPEPNPERDAFDYAAEDEALARIEREGSGRVLDEDPT
jgi:nucleoside-diphosphate-sugar epimerase